MSIENEPKPGPIENSISNVDAPKSKKKFWIFGSLGCLFFVVLICGGGGYWVFSKMYRPMMTTISEHKVLIESSEVAVEALGEPITWEGFSQKQTGETSFEYRLPCSGPKASGTLVLDANFDLTNGFEAQSYRLEVDGEELDLSGAEDIFNVDIDEGN